MKLNRLAVVMVIAAAMVGGGIMVAHGDTAPLAMTNKEVMGKAFKPDNALVKTVQSGKADESQMKEFLGYAQLMQANKPKKGEEKAWKERTQSIIDATQALLEKKDGALALLKTATNCATCHNAFK
jgi:hypothetical protein